MDEIRKYRFTIDVEIQISGRQIDEEKINQMLVCSTNEHGMPGVLFDDDDLDIQAFSNSWEVSCDRIA
jgi:hypothetical protein